jgi:hypothetical protein
MSVGRKILKVTFAMIVLGALLLGTSCRSSRTGEFEILGPTDETDEAAKLVAEANQDLQKIKKLYKENEGKREDIKKALEANDAGEVKRISDELVYIMNDGFDFGKSAVEKIEQAEDMKINDDYREYLRLKEEALKKQMEAFEEYRQAARTLRDNYDPKNAQLRDKVKEDFKNRSENYTRIMEKARDLSNQANELAKDALRRQQESQ